MIVKPKSNPSKTILTITIGFLVLFLVFAWRWALYTSLIVGGLGVLSQGASRLIESGWFKLSWLLGKIVPNVLLSAVFFLILTPIALLKRVFKAENSLMLSNKKASTFIKVEKTFSKDSLKNPW